MKKLLKIGLVSFVLGELITGYYKDEKFRQDCKNAKGFDKCKVAFNYLLDLNKQIFSDAKEVDYKWIVENYKKILDEKLNIVGSKIEELKQQIEQLHEDKLKPVLEDVVKKYEELQKIAKEKKEEFAEKYGPELKKLEDKIDELKNKLKK